MKHILIVGAGLTGLACALHLAQRGYIVSIYEYRSEEEIYSLDSMGSNSITSGKPMSMDLSDRAIHVLEHLKLFDELKENVVPMRYKIFHGLNGDQVYIPLGPTPSEKVLAISRGFLFHTLLERAKKLPNITLHFKYQFIDIDFSSRKCHFKDLTLDIPLRLAPDILIGTDGINSLVRKAFEKYTQTPFVITPLDQSYIELKIPPEQGKALEFEAMHFWMRDQFMLMAAPNIDHSFTCALLMHEEGEERSFSTLNAKEIEEFFRIHFADLLPLIPRLKEQYAIKKPNRLRMLQGPSWTCNGNFLLLGDAAHGTVPFFGQGVNCCFEDCFALTQCLDEANDHWPTALMLFEARRVKNANAMCYLSFTNYPELLYPNVTERTLLKKQIEAKISKAFLDDYVTYHNLVCFSRVPYVYAMACKNLQEPMLDRLSEGISTIEQLDWNQVKQEIANYKIELKKIEFTNISPHEF